VIVKTVRVSAKGQVTLPVEALRAMNVRKGTDFILIQEGDRIVLAKAVSVGRRTLDEFGGWEGLSAPAFSDLWDNDSDAVWDDA
jgi:bifunctional DNA-binding transcriptional regulator/antitoxin component of YhaV-PrlF toxin-antitoxin module